MTIIKTDIKTGRTISETKTADNWLGVYTSGARSEGRRITKIDEKTTIIKYTEKGYTLTLIKEETR